MSQEAPAYFVYILLCDDQSLYTGIALDVQKRLRVHQNGKGARYTRMHPPIAVLYQEPVGSIQEALKRERFIKSKKRAWKWKLVRSSQADSPQQTLKARLEVEAGALPSTLEVRKLR